MRKFYLLIALLLGSGSIFAQCNPADHDWGSLLFGVSPDPNLGENFAPGQVNQLYNDVVYVLTPTEASQVDTTITQTIIIDSLSLDSITLFNGIADVQLSTIGLNVTCNNGDDSPNPCMFLSGNGYCGDISGVPTVSGVFDVKIFATVYFQAFGTQMLNWEFEGYTLQIDPASVDELPSISLTGGQNSPNPASDRTTINYQLNTTSDVYFTLSNLVGETIMNRSYRGKRGDNQINIETADLQTGIYLYSLQTGDKKITRKMIVQH